MNTKQITAANVDEKIKQLYETAFPEDEQIPWKDLFVFRECRWISLHTTMAKTS